MSRRRRKKKSKARVAARVTIRLMLLLLLFLMLVFGAMLLMIKFAGPVFHEDKAEKIHTLTTFVPDPAVDAAAATVYLGDGVFLFGKEEDELMDPLSTTKLMTCYLTMKAIDKGDLTMDTLVEVPKRVEKLMESRMYLQGGEHISVEELLYGTLLHSSNDAAAVLGIAVSGNEKDFAALMNKEAKALGCINTNFVNANGLKAKGHKSTTRDMALIAEATFKYDEIRKICMTKKHDVPATDIYEERILLNTNPFLYKEKKDKRPWKTYNILAGKTGTWDPWNAALVEMSEYKGKYMYTVVMEDYLSSRYDDTKSLIKYGRKRIDELDDKGGIKQEGILDDSNFAVKLTDKALFRKIRVNLVSEDADIVKVRVSKKGVAKIEWKKVDGAEGYKIYRNDGDGYGLVDKVEGGKTLSYNDDTVKADSSCSYIVKGYKKLGLKLEK